MQQYQKFLKIFSTSLIVFGIASLLWSFMVGILLFTPQEVIMATSQVIEAGLTYEKARGIVISTLINFLLTTIYFLFGGIGLKKRKVWTLYVVCIFGMLTFAGAIIEFTLGLQYGELTISSFIYTLIKFYLGISSLYLLKNRKFYFEHATTNQNVL